MFLLLELDAEFADQGLAITVKLGDGVALCEHVFDAGVDERDRAPDQIGMACLKLLVLVDRLRGADQLRRDIVVSVAVRDVRPQIRQPPMLVAGVEAERRYWLDEDAGGLRRGSYVRLEIGRQCAAGAVV